MKENKSRAGRPDTIGAWGAFKSIPRRGWTNPGAPIMTRPELGRTSEPKAEPLVQSGDMKPGENIILPTRPAGTRMTNKPSM